jgi:LysR family transcriptional regulator, transcriptional activator of the cysJI operon
MHIESLKVFCDLIDTRSFSKAATKNFISQSAVSQQVRALEDRFDRKLVERSRGGLVATDAGGGRWPKRWLASAISSRGRCASPPSIR